MATSNAVTFAVDCKHWKRTVGRASMSRIAEKQSARAFRMASEGQFRRVVPLILTWKDEMLFVLRNGVPVVPIHALADFILNWEQSTEEIAVFESEALQRSLI